MELLLVGDVMIGRLINELLKKAPPQYIWGDTLPLFHQADVRICNLECVVSDKGRPWNATPKVFHFRADAKNIAALTAAGFDIVSVANNHALDFQEEAMLDMLQMLDANSIGHAGAGADDKKASMSAIRKINGFTIGFIAFSDNEPAWEAKKSKPGIYYVPIELEDDRAKALLEQVKKTSKMVDYLIVSTHWGPNWGYKPEPRHMPFGRALIEEGADLVFGHSCHVVQGIEFHQDSPIVYSAGNFVDDYAVDPEERNDRSFIYVAEVDRHETKRLKLYPTVIRDFQVRLAAGKERDEMVALMKNLCRRFRSDSKIFFSDPFTVRNF